MKAGIDDGLAEFGIKANIAVRSIRAPPIMRLTFPCAFCLLVRCNLRNLKSLLRYGCPLL
ncbi:MAG: hypothetical protein WBZ36_04190 [Candidatus Nitrosopolaris sp.]